MSEKIPIRLDGAVKGNLTVTREGLNTVFAARCEDPGRLVRLSVYGQGKEGYLGVMTPERGALQLTRRITRAGLSGFPEIIEYAAEAGQSPLPPPVQPMKKPGCATIPGASGRRCPKQGEKQPEKQAEEEGLLWYPTGDGSLYTTWQGRAYRAIPMSPCGLPRQNMVEQRSIQGVEYAVYEIGEK